MMAALPDTLVPRTRRQVLSAPGVLSDCDAPRTRIASGRATRALAEGLAARRDAAAAVDPTDPVCRLPDPEAPQ